MRGPKVCLALGAGGTKGLAHVGVLKVLQEAGVQVDCVAGASVGAMWGAGLAAGRTPDEMVERVEQTGWREIVDFFRHRLSLRHTNPVARAFFEAFDGLRVEELPLPFAAITADVVNHRPVILDRGDLVDVVEAAIAIPMLARPVLVGENYLVDGGVWESAPVSAADALGADRIIAVELGDPLQLPPNLRPLASWASGRLRRRCPADRPGRLSPLALMLQVAAHLPPPRRIADVIIRPDLRGLNSNSPFHIRRSMKRGEEAARRALPRIMALLGQQAAPQAGAAG